MFKTLYQKIIIIILDQHKGTLGKEIFKIIYNLHLFLKPSTPIFVVFSE